MFESTPIKFRPFERLITAGHRETTLFPELLAMPPEFVHSAGFVEGDQPISHDTGQRRGEYELATVRYTTNGRCTLRHQGREFVVEAGDAMVLYSPQDYLSRIEPGERWEFFYVTLCGRAALRTMREISGSMGPVFALDARSRALTLTADACAAALSAPQSANITIARNVESAREGRVMNFSLRPRQSCRREQQHASARPGWMPGSLTELARGYPQ